MLRQAQQPLKLLLKAQNKRKSYRNIERPEFLRGVFVYLKN